MCFSFITLVYLTLFVKITEPQVDDMKVLDHIRDSRQKNDNEESNIVGGFLARNGQFPYQASIQRKVNAISYWHTCGGSIIAKDYILSAAHCFPKPIEAAKYLIKVGSVMLSKDYQTRNVGDITVHSKYKHTNIVRGYDIALLRTRKPFKFDKYVDVVGIGFGAFFRENENCVVIGWGSNDFEGRGFPKQLKGLTVQLRKFSYCRKYSPHLGRYTFCAGGHFREDTCIGDSGGPLVCNKRQLGIISFGSDLCGQGIPTYCTNVTAFKDWIQETMTMMDKDVNDEGIKIRFHYNILIISHLFLFIFLPSI